MTPKDFLKTLMDRAGDNPNSLSNKTKVPQPTIFRFLSGTAKEPRLSTMEPIAKIYGVPVEAFFSEKVRMDELRKLSGTKGLIESEPATSPAKPELFWPFSASIEEYNALDDEKKQQLNDRVTWFMEGARVAPKKSA